MAHVGQELALGPVGRLGFAAGLLGEVPLPLESAGVPLDEDVVPAFAAPQVTQAQARMHPVATAAARLTQRE